MVRLLTWVAEILLQCWTHRVAVMTGLMNKEAQVRQTALRLETRLTLWVKGRLIGDGGVQASLRDHVLGNLSCIPSARQPLVSPGEEREVSHPVRTTCYFSFQQSIGIPKHSLNTFWIYHKIQSSIKIYHLRICK